MPTNDPRIAKAVSYIRKLGLVGSNDVSALIECVCESTSSAQVVNPRMIAEMLEGFTREPQEHFIVVTLNGAHVPIATHVVSKGLVNRTVVHPREVFIHAIRDLASGIIIAHNHPSGNVDFSPEDIDITKRLRDAGELIGIEVLDHIVIARKDHSVRNPLKFTSAREAEII